MLLNEMREFMHWLLRSQPQNASARLLRFNQARKLNTEDVITRANEILTDNPLTGHEGRYGQLAEFLLSRSRNETPEERAAHRLAAGYLFLLQALAENRTVSESLLSEYRSVFPSQRLDGREGS